MFVHDTLMFKALVGDELEYHRLVAAASGAILQVLPGYKGPVFRPSLEAPQTIIEAQLLWDNKMMVMRTNPCQVNTSAVITTATEAELNHCVLACIPHKYKEAVFDRVWMAPGVVQYRCTINCSYVAIDTFEELRAFWLPIIGNLSGGTERSFSVRTYSESTKDFLFTDMTNMVNVRTMLQSVSTVTIVDGDDTVVPYTSYEMLMELNTPDVQDLSKLMMLGAAVKGASRQICSFVVASPCSPEHVVSSAPLTCPTESCTHQQPQPTDPLPSFSYVNPCSTPCFHSLFPPCSNVAPVCNDACPPPVCAPPASTIASLEQALQELNQINNTFQNMSRNMMGNGTVATQNYPLMPTRQPQTLNPVLQQTASMQQQKVMQQYQQHNNALMSPPVTQRNIPLAQTIMTHVSQPIPQPPSRSTASTKELVQQPTQQSAGQKDTSTDGSEAQIDSLCRILENFISTIAPA